MSFLLFEGRRHASIYQKYRIAPPQEVTDIVLNYLNQKVRLRVGLLRYNILERQCLQRDFKVYIMC